MSSSKYQNIPLDQIEAGLEQDYDEIQISSSSSYNNAHKYETIEQDDDDSDTFVYKDGRNELSPTENKILEEIQGDEIVNYDDDDQLVLIQHTPGKNNQDVEINIKETEKSSIFGSTFNFTNSIIGAGKFSLIY